MMACFGEHRPCPAGGHADGRRDDGQSQPDRPGDGRSRAGHAHRPSTDDTIYRSQLRNRAESPAHRVLAGLPLLASIRAADAMLPPRCLVESGSDVATARAHLDAAGVDGAPVVDSEKRYLGIVSLGALGSLADDERGGAARIEGSGAVDASLAPVPDEMQLDALLERLSSASRRLGHRRRCRSAGGGDDLDIGRGPCLPPCASGHPQTSPRCGCRQRAGGGDRRRGVGARRRHTSGRGCSRRELWSQPSSAAQRSSNRPATR